MNPIVTSLLAALIPMILGSVWYSRKVFGNAWMQASGMTDEKIKGANMALIFGITFVFAVMIAFALHPIVIHQWGVNSLFMHYPDHDLKKQVLEQFGSEFRTFKHGALHGGIAGITIALPVLGINALFERKGFKYIAINAGYWFVCMMLMGGFICQFAAK